MNVIKERQAVRLKRIGIIKGSILKAQEPDLKKLAFLCCSTWGISMRTANELIKIAEYDLLKKENIKLNNETDERRESDNAEM